MSGGLVTAAYIVAAILFIFSLAGLSKHETSRQGNNFGIAGMAIALLATIFGPDTGNVAWILVAMIIGGAIGIRMAKKVEMTEMPELVAILHSFVGLAAVLVGFNSYLYHDASLAPVLVNIHLTEVFLGIFIGAVTFTGSIVAFGKLRGKISSKPLMLPNRHKMNLAALVVSFLLLLVFVRTESVGLQVLALLLMTIIALAFGWHLVASIGGADMPVVVSMLNSYSGWAAAAAGFMLSNDLLIVTGALVGSSGAILSYIMCKAMNRSFISVIAGGFGTDGSSTGDDQEAGEHREITAEETAEMLKNSHSVIITPGYGMAVAQAQYPVAEITEKLRARGINVRFGIHPVAGRLPGHMNVLLAEAKVPLEHPMIAADLQNPHQPLTAPGIIVEALARRKAAGLPAFTVMSCDNMPENGHVTRQVVTAYAREVDAELAIWIEQNVTFPSTMVDRIVPAVTPETLDKIEQLTGVRDPAGVACEPFRQWVIEDTFVVGRPQWENAGATLVADVVPFEEMKLRMLNGSHSFLAYLGYLAGYQHINDCMADDNYRLTAQALMLREQAPTLKVQGVDLQRYADQLIARYRNPALRHRTWQIAMDGSQKLPQRMLDSVRWHLANHSDFDLLALGVAGWMRYVGGVDEQGKAIDISDPLLPVIQRAVANSEEGASRVKALLGMAEIFGNDLPQAARFTQKVQEAYDSLLTYGAKASVAKYAERLK